MSIAPATSPGASSTDLDASLEAILRWPADVPLAATLSLSPGARRWPTMLARPAEVRTLAGLDDLRGVFTDPRRAAASHAGWLLQLDYELGALVEPTTAQPPLTPPGRAFRLEDIRAIPSDPGARRADDRRKPEFTTGSARSATGRDAYRQSVERVIEYIRAGDVFQTNVAHRISAPFEGSSRAFFAALAQIARPALAAYVEWDEPGRRRAVCSISPELFLDFDAQTRTITTRPIKGTRPAGAGAESLERSEKDAAELAMIVDLMRNDLGRVCVPGSIRVHQPRTIERHGAAPDDPLGLLHSVATIDGRLRPDADLYDALIAAFPPGSITGAPKVRAMQIINELERTPRAAYCGSIGYLADAGDAVFNVAIRTASIDGAPLDGARDLVRGSVSYPVGAGVVADSDPSSEWLETLVKAEPFLRVTGSGGMT